MKSGEVVFTGAAVLRHWGLKELDTQETSGCFLAELVNSTEPSLRKVTNWLVSIQVSESTRHQCASFHFLHVKSVWGRKGGGKTCGKEITVQITRITKSLRSEKAMAPHSSTLVRRILWTEEPGRLQSMGSLRVGHDWATSLSLFTFTHWRRKWQVTPVFLPGESQGRGSLVGCRLWGRTESDTTEVT